MEPAPANHCPRLVVIDDDEQVGQTIGRIARRGGYAPTVTTSFDEFKEAYDHGVSVVVIDLSMPVVDGVEIIRFLANHASQAGVLLASGCDRRVLKSAEQLAHDRGLRVLGSVGKPFAVDALLSLLALNGPAGSRAPEGSAELPSAAELRRALDNQDLFVCFQPKVDLRTRRLVGAEAVVRWMHESRGVILPDAFVTLAEEQGFIEELTDQVMERAFQCCAGWWDDERSIHVAVNLSSRSLSSIDLPDRVALRAARAGIRPQDVVLELTESCIADDLVTAADILTRFRLKGFELSIDDFGKGYSTLQQLERLPFSELKLDRSFVSVITEDAEARAIVSSSIELAHALNLRVVAEGIERPEQWALLAELGADLGQGHLIGDAMPDDEIAAWEERWRSQASHGGICS